MEAAHLLAFWGKTPRVSQDSNGIAYKPLLHHLMDVAAVALRWQQLNSARLEREAALLNESPECLARTTAFLAGIHDLGKFSCSFQAKVPELWPEQILGPKREIADRGHWRNTAILLRAEPISQEFASLFPSIPYDISPIIAAIAGHHGRPPEGQDEVNADPNKARRDQQLGEECVDAAHTAFCTLLNLIEPLPLSSLEKQKQAAQWSWRLSGLVTLADWVGSDSDYFSFESIDTKIDAYWDWALTQAEKSLAGKGLLAQSPESRPSYASFAPRAAARPRPMQKLAEEAPLKDGAQLFILEDTTGAGKTEAAIMLAARMMEAGKGEGLYFALPTMATANAMYERLAEAYQTLFETSAAGGVQECESGFDSALRRSVTVERLPDRITAETRALSAAKKEAAVLVICNAVDEAIAVYESLVGQVDNPDHIHLFHARFAQSDRQVIEKDVLHRFGRDAKAMDRAGHILVATQVVEQSLDLDFDLVISDLAPVDLIIQRAGRMWRHLDKRPPERRPIVGPQVLVVSPDPDQVEDANWLEPVLGKAAFVYQHAGVMWRSAKALFDAGRIDTPGSFRPLIERVYANEDVPLALEEKQIEDEGKEWGNRSLGRFNVVDLQGGYGSLSTELSGTEDIGTRLGEKTVTLRLAYIEEGRLVPWCVAPDDDPNRAWTLSEIRVREKFLTGTSPPSADQALHERAKRDWPEWERREILIAVVEDDGRVRLEGADNDFIYSKKRGMV
ncbi:MAG: CRISPR-associated helicase Cas3' [Gemmatimonadetes bacterium]|nr:CRISPR-associated helicase Cas3' [Gemmatimonadota bacterium]